MLNLAVCALHTGHTNGSERSATAQPQSTTGIGRDDEILVGIRL